jgi:hypothetical protein
MNLLKDMKNEELLDYLGLNEIDSETLDRDGIIISLEEASRILEKLTKLRYGDIRGHIQASGFANISYSKSTTGNCFLTYDYYDKILQPDNAFIVIKDCEQIKLFVSSSNWIDFFFDAKDNRVTMVLVP